MTSSTRKISGIFTDVMNTGSFSRSNVEHQSVLANNVEEIMVKVRHNYILFYIKLMILVLSSLRLPSSTTSCELALEMDGLRKWQLVIIFSLLDLSTW